MGFIDYDDEFVTLYDGESGIVLFEDVALDTIEELSSPGPKDDVIGPLLREVTQRATDAQLRDYVRRFGATVDADIESVREKALWIAATEHAEGTNEDEDEDIDFDDEDEDEDENDAWPDDEEEDD